jgi:hypothetical protein
VTVRAPGTRLAADIPHGTAGGYNNWRCRCESCAAANSRQRAAWVASLQDRMSAEIPHGTAAGYRSWACRCLPCRRAAGRAQSIPAHAPWLEEAAARG